MVIAVDNSEFSEVFQNDSHASKAFKRIESHVELCDVVLIAAGDAKRIPAHRLILIGCSDYFATILRESSEREVTLNDVNGTALQKLIDYCYTGCVELQEDSVKSLLTTANCLQLKEVVDACCEFLQRHLHPSTCLGIAYLAENEKLETLHQSAQKFICENFEQICTHPEFLLLTIDQLYKILTNSDLVAPTEEYVFRSMVKWIEYEPTVREVYFPRLLGLVRLPQLQPTFLASIVEPLCFTKQTKDLITQALKTHMQTSASDHSKPRKYNTQRLLTVFKDDKKLCIEFYYPLVNKWATWNTPIEYRLDFCLAMMDDNLIVIGGGSSFETLDSVVSLNLLTMEVKHLKPMQCARRHHNAAILDGVLYVMGGFSSKGALNTVERWNAVDQKWDSIASMTQSRFCAAATVLDERLYVVGGYNLKDFHTSVECYDSTENVWKPIAPLNVARRRHGLQAHAGCLYVFGGETFANGRCEDTVTVERYDPQTNTWTLISSPITKGGFTRCAFLGPDLFILNRCEFYMRKQASSEEDVNYEKLSMSSHIFETVDFIATPCVTPPQQWFKE